MQFLFVCFIVGCSIGGFLQEAAWAAASPYTDEVCENFEQVGRDYLSLELAGARWQGGNPVCLKSLKIKSLPKEQAKLSPDPGLLDPEFILPANRELDIKVKRLPDDLLEIRFHYIGKKGKVDTAVQDVAVLRLNFSRTRVEKGCASPFLVPTHFVMRAGCNRD